MDTSLAYRQQLEAFPAIARALQRRYPMACFAFDQPEYSDGQGFIEATAGPGLNVPVRTLSHPCRFHMKAASMVPTNSATRTLVTGSCFLLLQVQLTGCTGSELSAGQSGVSPPSPPPAATYTLTVSKTGSGTVTSADAGINCGQDCSESYDSGTSVTLSATSDSDSVFSGWSGPCSGTGSCVITMNQARSVTASFRTRGAADLNCTGAWSGSEESTTITAWPYRDCFQSNPVGTRTRMTNNAGAEVVWEQGTGWNGQNALRVRPPDGSAGTGQSGQGYAGLGEHNFRSVRTKRLNIRYLFRYNANWTRYAQRNKWDIAIKYDFSDPSSPVRREGCERGIVEGRLDPLDNNHENVGPRQGVCNDLSQVPNLNGWFWAPGVRENEWICVENEFDLDTGWYRTYITTQDGVFNQSLYAEINIAASTYGAPSELVPNPYWWGSIDCTTGCYWDSPGDQGVVPRPTDTYIWFSHFVMSNQYIGPPAGFVQ